MQQLFERRYRHAEQGLHVRIGLAAGESTVKDGDYFGVPSIEAARLCAQAPTDGILISGLVETLAGRCEGIEFSSVGELELKGFPDRWRRSRSPGRRWTRRAASRGSLAPARAAALGTAGLLRGAGGGARTLEEAMMLARAGQRQVVLLSGEPGIGKTRLASYAAHRRTRRGLRRRMGRVH